MASGDVEVGASLRPAWDMLARGGGRVGLRWRGHGLGRLRHQGQRREQQGNLEERLHSGLAQL